MLYSKYVHEEREGIVGKADAFSKALRKSIDAIVSDTLSLDQLAEFDADDLKKFESINNMLNAYLEFEENKADKLDEIDNIEHELKKISDSLYNIEKRLDRIEDNKD